MAISVKRAEVQEVTKEVWVEVRPNKNTKVMEMQVNLPYVNNSTGELAYSRNNSYIPVVDIPNVLAQMIASYNEATDSNLVLEDKS